MANLALLPAAQKQAMNQDRTACLWLYRQQHGRINKKVEPHRVEPVSPYYIIKQLKRVTPEQISGIRQALFDRGWTGRPYFSPTQ